MKATVDLPDEVFQQAQKQATERGQDLNQFLSDGLTKLIRASQPAEPKPGGHRVEFPIIKGKGGVLRLTSEEIAEIEAKEEAEYYARFMRR